MATRAARYVAMAAAATENCGAAHVVVMPTITVPMLIAVRVLLSIGKVIQPPGFSRGLQHCGGKAEWLHTLSNICGK